MAWSVRWIREAAGGVLAGTGAVVLLGLPLAVIGATPLIIVLALALALALAWAWPAGLPGVHAVLAPMAVLALLHVCAVTRMLAGYRPTSNDVAPWPVMQRAEAPSLFAVMDAMAVARGLAPIDQIWINDDCNASIRIERDRGPGTAPVLRMTLGFPLMAMLSPEQLRAVLAHEFGHVGGVRAVLHTLLIRLLALTSGRTPEIAGKRYARSIWALVAWVGRLFGPAAERRWRRLAHSCEYRADRVAAHCCGGALVAQTLVMIGLAKHTLATCWWPLFFPVAATNAAPAGSPFAGLLQGGLRWPDASERGYWLDEAMLCGVAPLQTHPRLGDRLRMLPGGGMPVIDPVGKGGSALSVLVPMQTSSMLADALDRRWPADAAEAWEQHLAHYGRLRQERDHLLCRRSTELLPARALERLGWLQRELGEADWRATVGEALASGTPDLTLAMSMAVEDAIETGDTAVAQRLLDQCRGHSDMGRRCHRWQLRLLHARGADPAALRPLRLTIAADAVAAYADAEEWESVAPAATFVPFAFPDHVRDDFVRALQRVLAVARSVSLLRQQSKRCTERHRLVVVVVPDARWQETLLHRLRICDSHQRLRCVHLLEAVSMPEGLEWMGTVQMPDSRLAGRVARGKAFSLTL